MGIRKESVALITMAVPCRTPHAPVASELGALVGEGVGRHWRLRESLCTPCERRSRQGGGQ